MFILDIFSVCVCILRPLSFVPKFISIFFSSFRSFSFIRSFYSVQSPSISFELRTTLIPVKKLVFLCVGIVNAAQHIHSHTQYNNLKKTRCCCTSSTNIKVLRFARSQQIITHNQEGDFYSSVLISALVFSHSLSRF